MQLRKTLARCHQNEKTMQDQVLKFWNSARPSIQKELWRNKLNPELSSWRKVVERAEIIEIAENVAERRDRRSGQASGAASGAGGGNPKGKHPPADGSVPAVTFGSHRRSHGKSHKGHHRNAPGGSSRGNTPHSRGGTPAEKGKSKSGSVPPSTYQNKHDSKHQKARQLSEKEKEEYRAAGRCFKCGTEGHMSRNCPDNATVRFHGHGPPGASTFNIEPVPLGAMFFGDPENIAPVLPWPLGEWKSHYPYWKEPRILAREEIGDCYAMVVDSILTLEPPFPGDER